MSKVRVAFYIAAALALAAFGATMSRYTHQGAAPGARVQASMGATDVGSGASSRGAQPVVTTAAGAPATPASADPKKPVNLGIPTGPFDPVLTQLPPLGRSLPPTNHRPNNPAGEDVSIVQSECTIAVFGDTVVAGWNDGLGFVNPSATISGYGYSVDRGVTWVDGGSVPNGSGASVYGDPSVVVTNSGQWVFTSLDLGGTNGLAVNRARFHNGTLTWNPSVKYIDGGAFLDKEFVEYDPATNRIYMTYTQTSLGQGKLTVSTDEGATWSSPVQVGSGGSATGYYPAVGNNGEVYVSWLNGLGQGNARLFARYSSNGGQTWASAAVQVVQLGGSVGSPPQCFNRSFNVTFPSMSVDRSNGPHRGRAYFCYTNGAPGNYDTFVSYSDDKGQTWSTPFHLDDETNTSEQFWPQVHVSPIDGRVSVGWYDRRNATNNNSLCDYYITQSVDGGANWGPNRRLSDQSVAWCGVPANIQPNFGDYIELTSDDRSVFGIWSDARYGGPDVEVGRFDDRFLLALNGTTGQGQRSAFDGAGTVWYIPNETDFTSSPAPALDSPAEMMVAAMGLGTLGTPQETNGMFEIAGESLHGDVTLTSTMGSVAGTFAVSRTGLTGVNLTFTATSSTGLNTVQFLPNARIQATVVPAGPGQANVFGTVSIGRLVGALVFSLDGTIHFDGAQGTLAANQSIDEAIITNVSPILHMHTRTTVVDGVTVDVPPISAGTNPPPLATVRAAPNPIQSSTKIVYTLTDPANGSIQIYSVSGRSVRTIAKGLFPAGTHDYAFDGRDDNGHRLPLGGYFIRFETDKVNVAGKLFIVNGTANDPD
jgi:hypothetical protein